MILHEYDKCQVVKTENSGYFTLVVADHKLTPFIFLTVTRQCKQYEV